MKKLVVGGAAVVGGVGVGALGLVVAQPDELVVTRTQVLNGAPEDVRPWVVDLERVNRWSPWDDLDPEMAVEYSETTGDVGSWYTWDGNDDVGAGRQTIQAIDDGRVIYDLHFDRPFESDAVVTTSWAAVDGGTEVTWAMHSENDFLGKAVGLLMDMDAMLGADFEKGLGELAPLVETTREQRELAEAEAARLAEAEPELEGAEGEPPDATTE